MHRWPGWRRGMRGGRKRKCDKHKKESTSEGKSESVEAEIEEEEEEEEEEEYNIGRRGAAGQYIAGLKQLPWGEEVHRST